MFHHLEENTPKTALLSHITYCSKASNEIPPIWMTMTAMQSVTMFFKAP
jgi:hypothetical protein